jgi:hypothetical protein
LEQGVALVVGGADEQCRCLRVEAFASNIAACGIDERRECVWYRGAVQGGSRLVSMKDVERADAEGGEDGAQR